MPGSAAEAVSVRLASYVPGGSVSANHRTIRHAGFTISDGTNSYTVSSSYSAESSQYNWYMLWEGVHQPDVETSWDCADLRTDAKSKGFRSSAVDPVYGNSMQNCTTITQEHDGDVRVTWPDGWWGRQSWNPSSWNTVDELCDGFACTFRPRQDGGYPGGPFPIFLDIVTSYPSTSPSFNLRSGIYAAPTGNPYPQLLPNGGNVNGGGGGL